MFEEYAELVHLSRLALAGRRQDIQVFIRRLARRLQPIRPDVSEQLEKLLAESPTRDSPLRNEAIAAVPTDADSRLTLARPEFPVVLDEDPIWADHVQQMLDQVLAERASLSALAKEGLLPTRTLLLTGNPGVGKTLAARWIATRLDRPLVTLDLSAVMSSFLGKTGANVRHVLDYAKNMDCVLLLDELDAVAKRRDDATEIGELKRLVTVLLQEIDDWPHTGLLIAATNHPDLLDPAVWRRFEMIVNFPMPNEAQTREAVERNLANRVDNRHLITAVSIVLQNLSFSDINRELQRIVRQAVMSSMPVEETLRGLVRDHASHQPLKTRKAIAARLVEAGLGQRDTHEWTGLHRDTLRKMNGTPRKTSD